MTTRTRIAFIATASIALAALLGAPAPAQAEPTQWLYTMQQSHSTLTTKDGVTGTLVLDRPRTLAFTDRPNRLARNLTAREALRQLGFPLADRAKDAPNAALTFGNGRALPLEIESARVQRDGRVVLGVAALGRPLVPGSGRSSLFIDDAAGRELVAMPVPGLILQATVLDTGSVNMTIRGLKTVLTTFTLTPDQPVYTLPETLTDGHVTVGAGLDFGLETIDARSGIIVMSGPITPEGADLPMVFPSTPVMVWL